MRRISVLCIVSALALGCAGLRTSAPALSVDAAAAHDDEGAAAETSGDIRNWIPDIFHQLWDTLDVDLGAGYGFGVHLKATNFLRVGIFDYEDFSLLGVGSGVFHGDLECPWHPEGEEDPGLNEILDLSATFGIGFGANFTVHTWEILDWVSTVVGFGYWRLGDG